MKKIDNLIFCLLISILFFTPLAKGTEKGLAVCVVHTLVLILLSLWIGEILVEKKSHFISTPLDYPIVVFVGLTLLASIFSIKPAVSFGAFWKLIDYIIVYYAVVNKLRTKNQLFLLVSSLMAVGAFLSVWGLIKYLGASQGRLGYELASTFANSNHLAAFLMMIIPIAIVLLILEMDIGKKVFLAYGLCMMLVAFVLTLSRGGWISLLCALMVLGLMYLKKYRFQHLGKSFVPILLIALVCLLFITGFGFNNVHHQLSSFFVQKRRKEIESFNGRVPIWQATLDLIHDYPVLGTGPGTFPYVYEKYLKKKIRDTYAHNEYLQLMSEWGMVSFLLILWMMIVIFKESIKCYLTAPSRTLRSLVLGIMGGLIAISIHCLVDFNFHFMANTFVAVVLTGMIMRLQCTENKGGFLYD